MMLKAPTHSCLVTQIQQHLLTTGFVAVAVTGAA